MLVGEGEEVLARSVAPRHRLSHPAVRANHIQSFVYCVENCLVVYMIGLGEELGKVGVDCKVFSVLGLVLDLLKGLSDDVFSGLF